MDAAVFTITQTNQTFDIAFTALPPTWDRVSVAFPGRIVVINLRTGQLDQSTPADRPIYTTAQVVELFHAFQTNNNLAQSTIASYYSPLLALAAALPAWPPLAADIDLFFDDYRRRQCSHTTLFDYYTRLNRFFNWAVQQGHLPANPMPAVTCPEEPTHEIDEVPVSDLVGVVRHLKSVIASTRPRQRTLPHERSIRDLAVIRLTYATGCRRRQIAGLQLSELYLDDRYIYIRAELSKSGKPYRAYFGRQTQRFLDAWLTIRPDDKGDQLFLSTRGNGWAKGPFTASCVYQAWSAWQAQAGVRHHRFHALRHSHVTHSQDQGIPLHHVSAQVGHANPAITARIYTHSRDAERQQAYELKNPDENLK